MPMAQLSAIANQIQLTIVAAERVFELLDEPEETADAPDAIVLADPQGAVQFDHVSFRYKADVPLIDDLSLRAAPGSTVAIVGPTTAFFPAEITATKVLPTEASSPSLASSRVT